MFTSILLWHKLKSNKDLLTGWNNSYWITGIFRLSIKESIFNINNDIFGFILYISFKVSSHSPKFIVDALWFLLLLWLSVEVIWILVSLLFIIISLPPFSTISSILLLFKSSKNLFFKFILLSNISLNKLNIFCSNKEIVDSHIYL